MVEWVDSSLDSGMSDADVSVYMADSLDPEFTKVGVGREAPGFSRGEAEPHSQRPLRLPFRRCVDWRRIA